VTGPNAETVRLATPINLEAAHWQLELWADPSGGHLRANVECMECGSGQLLRAEFQGEPFTVLDLVAKIEAHLPQCHGLRQARANGADHG
jgi:hypothetical protein